MLKLHTIIASTRPVRAGQPIGAWFHGVSTEHGKFETRLVDLKEVNLPLMDEAAHPRFGNYQHEHTKKWSATVSEADAFVFVVPEYNYFAPPSLVNALDFLFKEWAYKPAAFVSYGGMSGGLRSVQALKQVVTSLNMMPLPGAVALPMVAKQMDQEMRFTATEDNKKAAVGVLDELHRWATALKTLRA